jgi:hypothetical protein
MERAGEAFDAVLAFTEGLARWIRRVAVVALGGGVLIWSTIATQIPWARRPGTLAVWAIVLAACPAILFALSVGLLRLRQVRTRLRSLPQRVTERSDELRRLAQEARSAERRSRLRALLAVVRFWRTAAGTRELVTTVLPARMIFTPWVLTATLVALIGALLEILAAPLAAIWLLLGTAL